MYNQDFIVFKAVAETKNITLAAKRCTLVSRQ